MAILKCRMCGGDIAVSENMSAVDCVHCGSRQTVPVLDSGKKIILFSRAGRLLWNCEFDKAAGVYRDIMKEFPSEAEAYWGLMLCRFGVSYLDGPPGLGKLPACHRASLESVLDAPNFERAMENADPAARRAYREEAKAIEKARLDVIAQAENEPLYDIFLCHTADGGGALAQDIYSALVREGRRVFFYCAPLDAKSSAAQEPAVFAALNSASAMLVFGAKIEHFTSVWVKNVWVRFLAQIEAGQNRTLIPCCKGIGPRELPQELAELEHHEMDRPGAVDALLLRLLALEFHAQTPPLSTGGVEVPAEAPVRDLAYFLRERDSVRILSPLIAAGANHTAAVRADGKVIAGGYTGDGQCSVAGWRDAVAVAADAGHTVALRSDGTVAASGRNDYGQCNVGGWTDVVAIAAGASYTVGLRSDGMVVAAGKNDYGQCNVGRWTDIVAIAADEYRTIGLKSDGTVVVTGWATSLYKSRAVTWRDIVGIASSSYHTVGIKEDGTVTAIGSNSIPEWQDIVSVSTGPYHTVGLKSDGTVVAVGDNKFGQCGVSGWTDIVAVSAGTYHTVGLKWDGTVVAAGNNKSGQCDVGKWTLFQDLGALEDKIRAAEVRRQEREVLGRERAALRKEMVGLKGLFTGKRRKEIEDRLAEIDSALEE